MNPPSRAEPVAFCKSQGSDSSSAPFTSAPELEVEESVGSQGRKPEEGLSLGNKLLGERVAAAAVWMLSIRECMSTLCTCSKRLRQLDKQIF